MSKQRTSNFVMCAQINLASISENKILEMSRWRNSVKTRKMVLIMGFPSIEIKGVFNICPQRLIWKSRQIASCQNCTLHTYRSSVKFTNYSKDFLPSVRYLPSIFFTISKIQNFVLFLLKFETDPNARLAVFCWDF